jgi:hypothetical protein
MGKSNGFLLFTAFGILLLVALLIHASVVTRNHMSFLLQEADVVKNLGLTDLCLSTEARYTRHLSQADWHAASQNHPAALDHFPSGSIIGPPGTLKKSHAQID